MKKTILTFTFSDYDGFQQVRLFVGNYILNAISASNTLMVVAVNEAVNNAFKHGLSAGTGGVVTLKLEVFHGKRLLVRVRDPGPGFPVKEVLRKLEDFSTAFSQDNLFKETGRGLLIMKDAADAIKFNAKGNEVLLVKKITRTAANNGSLNAMPPQKSLEVKEGL